MLAAGAVALGGGIWLAVSGGRHVRSTWALAPYAAPNGAGLSAFLAF